MQTEPKSVYMKNIYEARIRRALDPYKFISKNIGINIVSNNIKNVNMSNEHQTPINKDSIIKNNTPNSENFLRNNEIKTHKKVSSAVNTIKTKVIPSI